MKEYIRTTHNFNNETREWDDRFSSEYFRKTSEEIGNLGGCYWSMGVHALEQDQWRYLRSIIDTTIDMWERGAANYTGELAIKELKENNPNYREIIKQDILKEFEILEKYGEIKVRDNGQPYMEFWDN
jgi:hypothetical protein